MFNTKTVLIIVNAILLGGLTIYLASLIVGSISMKSITKQINTGYKLINETYHDRRLSREAKRNTRTIDISMSLVDKVELYLIDKSNVRLYIPFMNFYTLLIVTGVIFIATYSIVYRFLYFAPSTAVICAIFATIPFMTLDLMGKYNSEVVRRRLAEFISVLRRWCAVKEDIFFAFEKAIESGIGEPLNSYIRDMVIQVKRGMEPVQALEILELKVDNDQFKDFILNIKQCLKNQGDILLLLGNMEKQFYKIEKEYNRRKISTYKDRMLLIMVMFGVLIIGYAMLQLPQLQAFYLGTTKGKLLLMLFAMLYAAGFIQFTKVAKFKH